MFVTFEGCEGVGKSTQLNYIKEYLEETNQKAVFLREPGGTEISEQIRKVILDTKNSEMSSTTEAMLYASARAQLVDQIIRPALNRGELVICDRFIDSSIAYQGYAREMGVDLIKKINAPAVGDCMPDLTIFIDLKPSESFRTFKNDDRLEQEDASFHDRVYEGYVNEIDGSNGRIVAIKPDFDKIVTSQKIIKVLKDKGAIR